MSAPSTASSSHLQTPEAVLESLGSSRSGLTSIEAEIRLKTWGRNELNGKKPRGRFAVFIDQFKDVMILLLAGAAIVSVISGEYMDAVVILAIILGNAILGYSQEYSTGKAILKLQQMAALHTSVVRDGQQQRVETAALVPGDIVVLEAGNMVPADARLIVVQGLKAAEAALTGESVPIDKIITALETDSANAGDRINMVFKGTAVSNGSGRAVVTSTGMRTEMGKIAQMLEGPQQQTPLQKQLARFSRQLTIIVVVICGIVFGIGLLRGEPALTMFLTALSLAVAALPEALPVVVTIALARGAARMAKQHALVRRLTAVETLGSVGYICTDKTGTLTQNKMTVEYIQAEQGKDALLLQAMLLNHEVKLGGNDELLGDPTETALVRHALEAGLDWRQVHDEFPTAAMIPFDSARMLMTTVHKHGSKWLVLVKGAPARVLEHLDHRYDHLSEYWLEQNRIWAAKGSRVMFYAWKELDALPDEGDPAGLENDLAFLGMACMSDPPREAAIAAIRECQEAGIKTVMITGDQALTAAAIARRLNIIRGDEDSVVTGAALQEMDERQFGEQVAGIRVYARVSPEQKLRIIIGLQANGQSIAMTGDGVNDAPSLKQADIGVAMGITGTDVAKEAAHMILLDDNFATIVVAIKEGRRIYENIRKFVRYILACNLGELLAILLAPLLGMPIPLLPIHILWINLVTDGLPGIALASEPAEEGIMQRPPRPAGQSLFADGMVRDILATGITIAAGALLTQYISIRNGYDAAAQHTMVFSMLCLVQLGNALSIRAGRRPIWHRITRNRSLLGAVVITFVLQLILIYVPFLNGLFKIRRLNGAAMLIACGIALACIAVIELFKLIGRNGVGSKTAAANERTAQVL